MTPKSFLLAAVSFAIGAVLAGLFPSLLWLWLVAAVIVVAVLVLAQRKA